MQVRNNNFGAIIRPLGWEHLRNHHGEPVWVVGRDPATEQEGDPGLPIGAIAVADALILNPALTCLDIAGNSLCRAELKEKPPGRNGTTLDKIGIAKQIDR
jgi:hypothetical protein